MTTVSNETEWNSLPATLTGTVTITSNITFTSGRLQKALGSATLNGGGYTLTFAGTPGYGLLSSMSGGTVSDLTIDGGNLFVLSANNGGIICDGTSNNGIIEDCKTTNASVTGFNSGGIICNMSASTGNVIRRCESDVDVNGFFCGGISYRFGNGTISNTMFNGTHSVAGFGGITNELVGGGTISCCFTDVDINSDDSGGIIHAFDSTLGSLLIEQCYTLGNISISSGAGAGAIIGRTNVSDVSITINDCYQTGSIGTDCGGIIGNLSLENVTMTINNFYQGGTLSGGDSFGKSPETGASLTDSYLSATPSDIANITVSGGSTTSLAGIDNMLDGNWSTSIWTAGTAMGLYPTLDCFMNTSNGWDGSSYTNYNTAAQLGEAAGGGGDPYIKPLFGTRFALHKH